MKNIIFMALVAAALPSSAKPKSNLFPADLTCHTRMGGGFKIRMDQDNRGEWDITLIATNRTKHKLQESDLILKKMGHGRFMVAFSDNPKYFYPCVLLNFR